MCSNIGTPNNHHFPFGISGKVVVLGVPILKHFRVRHQTKYTQMLSRKEKSEPGLALRLVEIPKKWKKSIIITKRFDT